jgi:glycosyltransferase involved in cell wall biosynthesis
MLRVVHVIGQMPRHGTQLQLAAMLRLAHGHHWNAMLAVLRRGDPLVQEISTAGVPVVEFDGRDTDPRRFVALRRLLRRADVVHSSLWGANAYARAAAASLRGRPAVVVSERSVEELRSGDRRSVDRVLRAWTEEYIANSSDVARFVARAHGVPLDRVSVIRNGVDRTVFFPPPHRPAHGSSARLGTVGRLVPEKGVDVLLAAMPAILARRPATLTVVGDGPERRTLETRARALPVAFAGELRSPSDVASFLRGLDVFVMPSRWEGLPNAVLEALACGVPVVASDVSGMAEAAEGRALLVPPGKPAALADAVCRTLESPPPPTVIPPTFDDVTAAHLSVFRRAFARRAGDSVTTH